MSCENPNRMFHTGYLTKNGKTHYVFRKGKIDSVPRPFFRLKQDPNAKPEWFNKILTDYEETPCQLCEGCRLDRAKHWMERCMLEEGCWENNEMITLTYNDENLPKNIGVDPKTGEIVEVATLCKEDIIKFKKDLRRYWKYHYNEDNMRFYMCGEYGDEKGRPHYHILFFNLKIRDKEFHKMSDEGFPLFSSKIIEKIWGKGWVQINEVNERTCAYVARYILKKQLGKGSKDFYRDIGRVPEYTAQTNKPGIGYYYFEENKDKIYEYDKLVLKTKSGAQQIKPAKYFDRLYDIDHHEKMEEIKANRKELAEQRQATITKLSGLTIEQQREHKANALHERLKKFKRNLD